MIDYRLLRVDETDAAARQHRLAGALIPGFDPSLHTLEETYDFYRGVFAKGPIWGAFDGERLVGHIAIEPGWIEHLYVERDRHGEGIGRALLAIAMREQEDLQLYTYAANAQARRLYDAAGFVVEEHGFDPEHVDPVPNVRYRWRRGANA
jgi:ribosomal protein S18 acetylase RimI-like enzyme